MIEKSGSIELRDISIAEELTPEMKEMAAGMVRVKHLYRSALKIAVTQMEILDEEFASLYDHSPIHHIEHRIKTLESAAKKLKRRGYDLTIDNIYAHIQDMAGVRVICNYLDDIYYLRGLLTRTESFRVIREADYIKEPKETGYRSLHLIIEIPVFFSNQKKNMRVEVQIRTIAMDFWASVDHQLKYKQNIEDVENTDELSAELKECADIIAQTDARMQAIKNKIYPGNALPKTNMDKLKKLTIPLNNRKI